MDRVSKLEEGGGQSGEISGGGDIGGSVDDPLSESGTVVQRPGPIASDIITIENDEIGFGTYSFCARAKVSANTDRAIFSMTAYYVANDGSKTKLKSIDVNANMFANVNIYQTVGFVFEYAGTSGKTGKKLQLVVGAPTTSSGSGSPTITIDYIMLNRATPAIYAIE